MARAPAWFGATRVATEPGGGYLNEARRRDADMTSIASILLFVISIAWWIIIIQAIMSWLISFNVLNIRQPFVYQVWSALNRVTEPIYRPIRNVLPSMGGLDLSPIVVLIGLYALRVVIVNNLIY